MADNKITDLENKLRTRMSRFMRNVREKRPEIDVFFELIRKHNTEVPAYLCGGAARNLLLSNNTALPRDLDIILGYTSLESIFSFTNNYKKRNNRFGGVSFEIKDWAIDIWPLSDTWAFKEKHINGNGFSDFPQTTFLDIEAITIELFCRKGFKRKIYSKGFFESILKRTIEINFEDNPFPAACVARSLAVADRFDFAMGPKLAKYIEHHVREIELEELQNICRSRYYNIKIENLQNYINAIKSQLRISKDQPVTLPKIPQYNKTTLFDLL